MPKTDWVRRYMAGAHAEVWQEMLAVGTSVLDDAASLVQAEAVARETMHRVRANVELLARRLRERGYEFDAERNEQWPYAAVQSVDPDAAVKLDQVEGRIGPIPLSIKAFFLEVGGVSFNGRLPGWEVRYADPLQVCTELDGLDEHLADMREQADLPELGGKVLLELAADYLHKANISGGLPYGVLVPDARADAPWCYDDLHDGLYFVDYLRRAIADGGLPGWRRTPGDHPPPDLTRLTGGLAAF